MNPRVQVVVQAPATLADLERACAAAREQSMPDDASVFWPLLSGTVVISHAVDVDEQDADDAPAVAAADGAGS